MLNRDIEEIALTIIGSRVRRDTFVCICDKHPKKVNAEEIARRINSSKENVLGALRGMNKRYKAENSLCFMGSVSIEKEIINGTEVNDYRVTPLGLQVMELMKNKNMITLTDIVNQ